jgi:hypothetical protein
MTIFIKDDLRASVEAATGGLCTVLYTAKNQPTFMRKIPKFNLQDIDASLGTGVHPAFIVNGAEVDSIMVGMYQGIVKNGELLSLPGVMPTHSQTYSALLNNARACGAGYGLTTNSAYAALFLWSLKNGTEPRGNTYWGRNHLLTHETGVRQDNIAPGSATGHGGVLTGSGPLSWRHDASPAGIADLVGNYWEFSPGLRLVDGEIQIIANNDAATLATFDDTAPWKAILQDGSLVAPGTANTLKYSSNNSIEIATAVDTTKASVNKTFSTVAAVAGVTVPSIMKALMLAPSLTASGTLYVNDGGQRYPLRGGSFFYAGNTGSGALALNDPASSAYSDVVARPAKV